MRWLARAPLALAAMMMSAADLSTTNPPGGSSTCTNSCDCHSSFSSDAPTTVTQAAPRPALLGATDPIRPSGVCFICKLNSAGYIAIQGPACPVSGPKNVMPIVGPLWDAGTREFTATNDLLGGDPCLGQTKQLDISVMFLDGNKYVVEHWHIRENTTQDLGTRCCPR